MAVLDDVGCLVENLHDLVQARHLALDHGRDHDPGRGGADDAGQEPFGEVDQFGVGFLQFAEADIVAPLVGGELAVGLMLADEADDEIAQVGEGGAAAPDL